MREKGREEGGQLPALATEASWRIDGVVLAVAVSADLVQEGTSPYFF